MEFEQSSLNTDQTVWLSNLNQQVSHLATHLAFAPDPHLDLYQYGLMPMISLSPTQYVIKDIETTVPLLRAKPVQWEMVWQGEEMTAVLFIKLGTGGRVNHCQLVLSIFQTQADCLEPVATAQVAGPTVQDGQWTAFQLNRPLPAGHYLGQLESPDADNQVNTLFLWLTVEFSKEIRYLKDNVQDLFLDGWTPILTTTRSDNSYRINEMSLPVLRGKTVQWYNELAASQELITSVFIKLGTGSKLNQCHLVLTILQETHDHWTLVAIAQLDGLLSKDNEWNEFVLDRPLVAGQYICRLQSPDTDDTDHTLFVRLTPAGLDNYCYVSPPPLLLRKELAKLPKLPKLSVIVPIFEEVNIQASYLQDCLDSVRKQIYGVWELCIATSDWNVGVETNAGGLEALAGGYPPTFQSPSIDLHSVQWVHGSPASLLNKALAEVTGDYFVILHPTDLLTEDALLEVAKRIIQMRGMVGFLYSDEDTVNHSGQFSDPYFKPNWAKEMLKGQAYTGQLGVYQTTLVKRLGGFREHFSPPLPLSPRQRLLTIVGQGRETYFQAQIWDLVLRVTEANRVVQQIPKILYHRRRQPPLLLPSMRPAMTVVQRLLEEEKRGGFITANPSAPQTGLLHYPVSGQPLVSVIIPTRDLATLLESCLQALRKVTTYPHWEVIVVDNGSQESATLALFEKYKVEWGEAFRVIRQDIPFNFSTLVNHGVKVAKGEIILLLNNDTEILGPSNWLQDLLGFAQHPDIACVGCKLLYPQDQTIQHAGLITGVAGVANHGHKHFPAHSTGYFQRLAMVANYSAITGACLMVRKALWEKVNGFDENLGMAFNDVDFCLKLLSLGLRHVVLPHVHFYHHESKTRGLETTVAQQKRLAKEAAYMKKRWGWILPDDPFYSPHLTREWEDFRLGSQSIYYGRVKREVWWRKFWKGDSNIPFHLYPPLPPRTRGGVTPPRVRG